MIITHLSLLRGQRRRPATLAVGLILLTLALWRGGIAPLWCFIPACMGFLVDFLGPAVPGAPIIVAGLVVLTTGWLAIVVLRMPSSAWDACSNPAESAVL